MIANQGNVQFANGDARVGNLHGRRRPVSYRLQRRDQYPFDGSGGAYWRLKTVPEYGNLSIGANFFAMHYSHNEDAFTYGMGGYFSPRRTFWPTSPSPGPATITRWHYNIMGSPGRAGLPGNDAPLSAARRDMAYTNTILLPGGTTTYDNLHLPAMTSVGPNYDLRAQWPTRSLPLDCRSPSAPTIRATLRNPPDFLCAFSSASTLHGSRSHRLVPRLPAQRRTAPLHSAIEYFTVCNGCPRARVPADRCLSVEWRSRF